MGHVLLFFVAGFAQFSITLNGRTPGASVIWLFVLLGGVYLLGGWAAVTFIAGGVAGGYLGLMQRAKNLAESGQAAPTE